MRKLAFLCLAFALVVVSIYGCDETTLTEPPSNTAGDPAEEATSQGPLLKSGNGAAVLPFWATGGNANTNPSSQFFGTLDNQSLAFRTNGAEAMRVLANGRVGIGTPSPAGALHVKRLPAGGDEVVVEETTTGSAASLRMQNTTRSWSIFSDASPDVFFNSPHEGERGLAILGNNGYVGFGRKSPGHPLHMASGAHVTAGGVWTDASSRAYKENIRELTIADARTTLEGLTPVQFNYKADKDEGYVGFIAEDVPDLVATQDRKGLGPMDIVAVLTKVVQQQEETIAELEARLDAMQ